MNASIDVSNILIKTQRTILRPFLDSDLDDFFEYAKVDGVGERAGWPHHENIKTSKKILEVFIKEKKTLAIVNKLNNKVIGSIGIEEYGNEEKLSEFFTYKGRSIGYVLSKEYWNKGIMSEVLKAVVDYLFNVLDYDFLLCGHYEENLASARVQEKCGFTPYRKLLFDTKLGIQKLGKLNLLVNPNKNIKLVFSHPETLIIND